MSSSAHYVIADRTTGRVSGWATLLPENIARVEMRENQVFMPVERQPNLEVDHYVNFATGEMSSEPFIKLIPKD